MSKCAHLDHIWQYVLTATLQKQLHKCQVLYATSLHKIAEICFFQGSSPFDIKSRQANLFLWYLIYNFPEMHLNHWLQSNLRFFQGGANVSSMFERYQCCLCIPWWSWVFGVLFSWLLKQSQGSILSSLVSDWIFMSQLER